MHLWLLFWALIANCGKIQSKLQNELQIERIMPRWTPTTAAARRLARPLPERDAIAAGKAGAHRRREKGEKKRHKGVGRWH